VFGLAREEIDEQHDSIITQRLCIDGQRDLEFAAYVKERLPGDFGSENAHSLASFLLDMLQISPERRLPAKDLLSAPFLLGRSEGWRSECKAIHPSNTWVHYLTSHLSF
jgi:hypothetical protein